MGRVWTRVEGSKDLGGDRLKDSDAVVEGPRRDVWPQADLLSFALGQGGARDRARESIRHQSAPLTPHNIQTED